MLLLYDVIGISCDHNLFLFDHVHHMNEVDDIIVYVLHVHLMNKVDDIIVYVLHVHHMSKGR
jgi:hypothetical protein